jgi:cardiolipin synthase
MVAPLLAALAQTGEAAPTSDWQWLAIVVAIVGEGLAIVFVSRILARGGAPASTLLWVFVILAAPWIGMMLYYLFPRRLQRRRLRLLRTSQQRWRLSSRGARSATDGGEVRSPSPFCRLLLGLANDRVSAGNRVSWLPSGADFFNAAALAIEGSTAFVHVAMYIFRPDATGLRLLSLLAGAAKRGVAVRLLYDSFGSWGLKDGHLHQLRAAGGCAEAFLPLLWKRRPFTVNLRNHRKLVIVDGAVAFTGGRNVGDEYAHDLFDGRRVWHDAMVKVEGPAVAALHEVFAEDWYHATDEELSDARWFPPPRQAGDEIVGVVGSGPDRELQELWWAMLQAIGDAQRSIDLSSPYLLPPPSLFLALAIASQRGVQVRLHTNGAQTEATVLYHAQRSYYRDLLRAGIEIRETTDDYNHTKVLVVDETMVVVGSANMDMRSAHLNFEVALALPDSPDLARTVLATLAERGTGWRRVELADLKRSHLRRVIEGFCRLLSPLL